MSTIFIHIPKNGGTSIGSCVSLMRDIKMGHHYTDVSSLSSNTKTIIVIRNPLDRFSSAVRHTFQRYPNIPQNKKCIELGITTPNLFSEIWANEKHEHHHAVLDVVLNNTNNHKIGYSVLKYEWTFTPQYRWIQNPAYVILFEQLEKECSLLFKTFGYSIRLPKKNVTKSISMSSVF